MIDRKAFSWYEIRTDTLVLNPKLEESAHEQSAV